MKRWLLALGLLLVPSWALAQGCGPTNPNCIVPTAPVGTSNNQAASTAFVANAFGNTNLTRIKLLAPTTFYADSSAGTDNATCGLASGVSACASYQYLFASRFVPNYDCGGQVVTLSLANNDTQGLAIGTPWTGGCYVVLQGPGGSPPTIGLNPSGAFAGNPAINIGVPLPGVLVIQGMTLGSTGGGNGHAIAMLATGIVQLRGNVVFNSVGSGASHIFLNAAGANLYCYNSSGGGGGNSYTINSGALFHYAVLAGSISCATMTFAINGTPTFTVFAGAYNSGSAINLQAATFAGSGYTGSPSVTGQRWLTSNNGSILFVGNSSCVAGANLLPGSTPGTCSNGGQFL